MKATFLTFLFLAFALSGFSQNCKLVKTETDKFTKKEIKSAHVNVGKIVMFVGGVKWRLSFAQEKGNTIFKAHIAMIGEFNQVFGTETKFYFLLDNGDVLVLNNSIDAQPKTQVINDGTTINVFTNYMITLSLSKEDLKKLGSGTLTDVKVEVPDQNIKSPIINSKNGKKIQDIANCLAETAL